MKHILLSSLLLLASMSAGAQRLMTESPVYDCGQVLFRSPVTATFVLKNSATRSTTIKEIESSCGCTSATPHLKNIGGGKEVTISTTYDAKQLGHFQKKIWVYEEGQKNPTELTIMGVVVPELKDFTGNYPYTINNILCDKDEIEFDDVYLGSHPTQEIRIYNNTMKPIQPQIMHLPSYLTAEVTPRELAPDQAGIITLTLESGNIRDLGLNQTSIYLGKFPGDKVSADKEITVSTVLLPSFSEADRNSSSAPSLQISATTINTDDMTGKPAKRKGEIILQNTGQSPLTISSLQMFTSGLQVALGKSTLKPGEQTKLKIIANTEILSLQRSRPRILMITNDPKMPKVVIQITGK